MHINAYNFPDEQFRKYVKQYDKDADDSLSNMELDNVTSMNCDNKNIADLKGIEHFKNLQYLHCFKNKLTTLDLSSNTALILLDCSNNKLSSLNVIANTALENCDCKGNNLISLYLGNNTVLKYLECQRNQLLTLDISANTALEWLICNDNQLSNLNVITNTALEKLVCDNKSLRNLNVGSNTSLLWLICNDNQLSNLNVSTNTALCSLYCYNNPFTKLDVSLVPALKELVINGLKDSSEIDYDKYTNGVGNELYVEKTVELITGSSGGSGSGGSSTKRLTGTSAPGLSSGSWKQDANGWWFEYTNGSYPKNEWKELPYSGDKAWYCLLTGITESIDRKFLIY